MFWYDGIGFRPVEEDDLDDIRFLRNEPSTWMNLTSVGQINRIEQREWHEKVSRDPRIEYYSIVKEEKAFPISFENGFLGIIRMDEIDINNRSIRVGADIVPDERRKGYGTKAFEAILKYCFDHLNMHRLWLCVLEDNEIAKKLYKNVGFQEEGKYREAIWRDGKYHNYIVMSILEGEYKSK